MSRSSERLEKLEAACRQMGLPLTVQRRMVLEALVKRTDHPTADQILEDVRTRLPEVSRTTVYRVLETLVRLGMAVKICHPGASARFDPKTERHHHLVCVRCETVVDIETPALRALPLPDTRGLSFEISDYSVHFRGLCAACGGGARKSRHAALRGAKSTKRNGSERSPRT